MNSWLSMFAINLKRFIYLVFLGLMIGATASTLAQENEDSLRSELAPGVWFEVQSLRRIPDKDIVEFKFEIVNESDQDTHLDELGLTRANSKAWEWSLGDFDNKKTYRVGTYRSGSGTLATSTDDRALNAGERRQFWAWLGAPKVGVDKLSVLIPGQVPLVDVPLTKYSETN